MFKVILFSTARGDMKVTLKLLSETADCLSDGDLVEKKIRSASNWSLLPTQVNDLSSLSLSHSLSLSLPFFTHLKFCIIHIIFVYIRTCIYTFQAMFSSVLPGQLMCGYLGRPEFPRWLGNHSSRGKNDRLLQELQRHTRLV